MNCPRCGTANVDANKYCGNCGINIDPRIDSALLLAIDQKIEAALAAKLTDQRIVEIEIQDKVIERLKSLSKIVGIPSALLLALLSLWGIKSLSDAGKVVQKAEDDAVAKMNQRVAVETDKAIKQAQQSAKTSLDAAVNQARKDVELRAQDSAKQIDTLKAKVESQANQFANAINAQNAKVGQLQEAVNRLTAQQIGTKFEGSILKPYQDTQGHWTIGSSHLLTPEELASGKLMVNGSAVEFHAGITQQQSDQLLQQDLDAVGEKIAPYIKIKLNKNQQGALEDFVFNVGLVAFLRSNMLKDINNGNLDRVPDDFINWKMPYISAGQISRRKSEAQLWKTP